MRTLGRIMLWLLAAIGAIIVLIVLWWMTQVSNYVHRFRLGVEIATPEGLRTSSSVIEIRKTDYRSGLPGMRGVRSTVHGEAVFVDLGPHGHVIALLGFGPTASEDKIAALAQLAFSRTNPRLTFDQVHKLKGSADLSGSLVPTLVTFTDLGDPRTAKVVYAAERATGTADGDPPTGMIDNMAETFGPGVSVKRVWIEMVDVGIWPLTMFGIGGEPITRGIEGRLGWWGKPFPWIKMIGPTTGVDTRPFVSGEYRLMTEQFRRSM